MRLSDFILIHILCVALPGSVSAAPVTKSIPSPIGSPVLKSILVQPSSVKLVGGRARQGIVISGVYADGSFKDLTAVAKYSVAKPGIVVIQAVAGQPILRPAGNGSAQVMISVPGVAPQPISVVVDQAAETQPVSFKDEVVPALTKLGCSAGTCHGTPTGKGGFRLSLQGYAPDLDYNSLVREGGGRRIAPTDPGRSLLLLKPLVQMAHAGGKRLSSDMPEYAILTRWIAEGAKDDPDDAPQLAKVEILPGPRVLLAPHAKQRVVALGHFSDGSVRDVTHLTKLSTSNEDLATITRGGLVEADVRGDIAVMARYQVALQSLRLTFLEKVPGFQWSNPPENNFVDRHVFERLKLFKIPVSGLSGDTEFLRRAYLDTIGLLPTAVEVKAFVADPAPDKRVKLIDRLTERPEFADHWTVKWADVLRIADETMGEVNAKAYHRWLRDRFARDQPLSDLVREILTASGPTGQNPAVNYFRAHRNSEGAVPPEALSEATAQLFLGVRMTCARCHNHPFERWTQNEYYELAAFFGQVRRRETSKGEETVYLDDTGEVNHLRTGKVMTPRLLGGTFVEPVKGQDRRVALADWMVSKDNPFFAKAIANRVWAHLLGRGIVEPVDDFRDSNPAVNEALITALGQEFADHRFSLKHLVRTIMNSRTYQLTAHPEPLNKDDATYFSHAQPRMLTAEQLADAIVQVTGVPDEYTGYPAGTRAAQLGGTKVKTGFLKTFGRPDRNLNCECEREKDPTLFQALKLITDRDIDAKLKADSGRIAQLAGAKLSDAQVLDELYFRAFARAPSAKERQAWISYFARAGDRRKALEDLGWVLINSKEFLFRH
jgi:hypothetical protein